MIPINPNITVKIRDASLLGYKSPKHNFVVVFVVDMSKRMSSNAARKDIEEVWINNILLYIITYHNLYPKIGIWIKLEISQSSMENMLDKEKKRETRLTNSCKNRNCKVY